MSNNIGKVIGINGNLLSVEFYGNVSMNEICYVNVDNTKLKSEVIRIRGDIAQIQVYEMTNGIKCGDEVETLPSNSTDTRFPLTLKTLPIFSAII